MTDAAPTFLSGLSPAALVCLAILLAAFCWWTFRREMARRDAMSQAERDNEDAFWQGW